MKCKHFPQAFKGILIKLTKEQNACSLANYVENYREIFQNFNGRRVLRNLSHLKEMVNWFFFLIFFIKLNCRVLVGDVDISFV